MARRSVACGIAAVVLGTVCWALASALLRLSLVTSTLATALLMTALLWPSVGWLHRRGTNPPVAASVSLVTLLAVLGGFGLLVWGRVTGQVDDLAPVLTAGIDSIRAWLTTGPLHLDPGQVDSLRDQAVSALHQALPRPTVGARAWTTSVSCAGGITAVAVVDALLIGTVLFVLGVLGVLAAVLVLQQVEGNLLQPVVVGRAVHLHPVVAERLRSQPRVAPLPVQVEGADGTRSPRAPVSASAADAPPAGRTGPGHGR